jgi:hypothetical protein
MELKTAEEMFYSVFPRNNFELKIGTPLEINYIKGKITVRTPLESFRLLHEMAHIIETPNANLYKTNFGLTWNNQFELVGDDVIAKQRKTEVAFKRELRVFGIQSALNIWTKYKFNLNYAVDWNTYRQLVIHNLTGVSGKCKKYYPSKPLSPYMCDSLKERNPSELRKYITNKLLEYNEIYHHTKLPQILKRKFEYINGNL